MDTQSIIAELEAERERLEAAIEALQGSRRSPGRPKLMASGRTGQRRLSTAARKRISDAMKANWAKRKRAA